MDQYRTHLTRFQARKQYFQWGKERWKNSDFGLLPTTWTLVFWDKKRFYFVFSLRSRLPKRTSKISKTISSNRRVLSNKFWINIWLIWLDFKQGNNTFNGEKKDEKTLILDSFQPHGRWVLEIRKNFISCFPCVLDFQNAHPEYLKLSLVTGDCCQISFGSISDSSESISSKETILSMGKRKMKKQWFWTPSNHMDVGFLR